MLYLLNISIIRDIVITDYCLCHVIETLNSGRCRISFKRFRMSTLVNIPRIFPKRICTFYMLNIEIRSALFCQVFYKHKKWTHCKSLIMMFIFTGLRPSDQLSLYIHYTHIIFGCLFDVFFHEIEITVDFTESKRLHLLYYRTPKSRMRVVVIRYVVISILF